MAIKKQLLHLFNLTLVGILTTPLVIAYGILSFSGMWAIQPVVAFAWIAFCFNGLVDGQVILDNVRGGIEDPKYFGKEGWHALITKALEKHLSENRHRNDLSVFEKEYLKWFDYIAQFKDKKLSAEDKRKLEFAKKRLRRIQKYFVHRVLLKYHGQQPTFNKALINSSFTGLFNHVLSEMPNIHNKIWALRFSIILSVLAGIVFGFATASALTTAATVSIAGIMPFVWPLAIFSMIGYSFLTLHNMKRIIFSESLDKWIKLFTKWLTYKKYSDSWWKNLGYNSVRYIFSISTLVAAFSLSVIATMTTGYTWWTASQSIYYKFITPAAVFANLLFMLKNSMDSTIILINTIQRFSLSKQIHRIKKFFHSHETTHHHGHEHAHHHTHEHREDTLGQEEEHGHNHSTIPEFARRIVLAPILFLSGCWSYCFNPSTFNPFRLIDKIISLPYETVIFIGHSIAVGLVGDQYPGWERLSAIAGAIADMFVDFCYIFSGHDHHGHQHNQTQDNLSFIQAQKQAFGVYTHAEIDVASSQLPRASNVWLHEEISLRAQKQISRIQANGYSPQKEHTKIREVTALEGKLQKQLRTLPAKVSSQTIFKTKPANAHSYKQRMHRDYPELAKNIAVPSA